MIVSHYLDALAVSKMAAQMMAIFGGKNPHPQTLVVGGVTCVMDTLNASRIGEYLFRLKEVKDFVETAYIPDVLLAARHYKDEGLAGHRRRREELPVLRRLPAGRRLEQDPAPQGRREERRHRQGCCPSTRTRSPRSHARLVQGQREPQHPYEGKTEPEYTGFDANGHVKGDEKYTWCKAPTLRGRALRGRPARTLHRGLCPGRPEDQAARRQHAEGHGAAGDGALLHPGKDGCTGARDEARRRPGRGLGQRARRQYQGRRHAGPGPAATFPRKAREGA